MFSLLLFSLFLILLRASEVPLGEGHEGFKKPPQYSSNRRSCRPWLSSWIFPHICVLFPCFQYVIVYFELASLGRPVRKTVFFHLLLPSIDRKLNSLNGRWLIMGVVVSGTSVPALGDTSLQVNKWFPYFFFPVWDQVEVGLTPCLRR